jgi:hypothetical protein
VVLAEVVFGLVVAPGASEVFRDAVLGTGARGILNVFNEVEVSRGEGETGRRESKSSSNNKGFVHVAIISCR